MAVAETWIAPTLEDSKRASAKFLQINTAYPGVKKVSDDPPIYTVEGFLSPEECKVLVDAGIPGLARSIVVDGVAGKSSAPSRTSESCYLNKRDVRWLGDKIAALTTKSMATHEPPQVARYKAGQFYLAHFDAFDVTTAPGRECAMTGGQRVATVLIYLTTVREGGGTYFPRLDKRFLPVQGNAVVFFPTTLDGKLDPQALHAAEDCGAVDEKWVCQVWIRQSDFDKTLPWHEAVSIGAAK